MERLTFSKTDAGFLLQDFPDAVKVIVVDRKDAKRLADLSLHKADLKFADKCLDAINQAPVEPFIMREALWRSAVIHYLKCFGNDARFQLVPKKIYKGESPEALEAFNYFKILRNSHLVHDENSYAQSIPGAVLNSGNKNYKIEKIVCFTAIALTLEQGNYGNLKLLIQNAMTWVTSEFDTLSKRITAVLEKENYDKLLAKDAITYQKPTIKNIPFTRKPRN